MKTSLKSDKWLCISRFQWGMRKKRAQFEFQQIGCCQTPERASGGAGNLSPSFSLSGEFLNKVLFVLKEKLVFTFVLNQMPRSKRKLV